MLRAAPLLVLLALAACSNPPAPAERAPARESSDPPAPVSAAAEAPAVEAPAAPADPPLAAADDRPPVKPVPQHLPAIVARVNGAEISRVEFENAVKGLAAEIGTDVPPEERDRVYREVLEAMITQRLLVQEAIRRVTLTDAEVDRAVQEVRGQFPSQQVFQQALAAEGLTIEALRVNLQMELALTKLFEEEFGDRIRPGRDDVSAYYRENREQFRHARVRVSHILVPVSTYADADARVRARQQAESLVTQLQNGADFAALARRHSQDTATAPRGGDLGYFEWGELMEPLNEAAFRLQPRAQVEVLESRQGYHVLMVTDRESARTVASLEEVRPVIEEILESANRERETDAFISALRERSKVQIYF